jgi:tetratricopeptide (TPR) repeat protein
MEFNAVHDRAVQMVRANRLQDALKLFYHLAEGDRSLDGGSLGHSIGECYEGLGDLHAARYWYARAFEENPVIELYRQDYQRLKEVTITDLIG